MNTDDQFWRFSAEDTRHVIRSTFVQHVEHHTTLPSTNSRALVMATDPTLVVPALVLSDQQTAGRGRGVNRWWSERGSLTFSIILDFPGLDKKSLWPRVSLTAGIAVCEALHQLCPGLDAAIKWPNDVYVRTRKISGILVEVPAQNCQRMVIGIGANVNNAFVQAPESIRATGTSLVDVTGYCFSLTSVLVAILNQLSSRLTLLQCHGDQLQQQWQAFCMLTGRRVQVDVGARRTVGICRGINSHGALLLDTANATQECPSGVVTVIE